jgi:chloramphenicol O-acetyltransferase type A
MRKIELQTWPRQKHFYLFRAWDHPHFNMCAPVDLTACFPIVRGRNASITVAIVYLIARAANAIPEFRYRIRAGEVIEHEVVHPSTTILAQEDLFSFCTFEYAADFSVFAPRAAAQIASVQAHPVLENEPGRDDLLYMSAIPWVSFTSFTHPMHLNPPDSIPRFAWGKFFEENGRLKMPLSVQGHHALMDGIHVGRFYAEIQSYLDQPEVVLGMG